MIWRVSNDVLKVVHAFLQCGMLSCKCLVLFNNLAVLSSACLLIFDKLANSTGDIGLCMLIHDVLEVINALLHSGKLSSAYLAIFHKLADSMGDVRDFLELIQWLALCMLITDFLEL